MDRLVRDVERPPFLDKGRRHIHVPDGLALTVSDESADWAVNIHDRLIKALSAMACKFSAGRGKESEPEGLICEHNGEKIFFAFSEGYRKVELTADEIASAKKRGGWSNGWEWRPSGRFTWSVRGSEHPIGHQWSGKRADIEAKLPEIVAACLEFLDQQPAIREARLAEEARRRHEAEERERQRRTTAARREQLDHAFEISQLYERERSLKEFLDVLESRLPEFTDEFRPKLVGWLQVVRAELANDPPHVRKLGDAIFQPYWRADQPDWWPTEIPWPREEA